MNEQISERIREFAYETSFEVPFEGPVHFVFYNSHLKKFAELIVRECMGVIKADPEDGETINCISNLAIMKLEKHFGIE